MSGPTRHVIGACDDTMAAAGVRAIDYLTATWPYSAWVAGHLHFPLKCF